MELTSDVKFVISILVATVLVIGGGAYLTSKKSVPTEGRVIPDTLTSRLAQQDSPSVGPNDAKVTIVEFGDFECPSCGAVHPLLQEVKEKYKDQSVRFVFRNFPLPQHEHAFLAAEAAMEAAKQNKFWEYHDILFENQANLTREDLNTYADELGLNKDEFNKALEDHTHTSIVERDQADGRSLSVQGTPTFFINNTQYSGKYTLDAFSSVIDKELNK